VGLWAMISMAALMGGTMRSPFTALIFTLELTHDLNVLPALLIGCIAADAVTVLLLRRSILTEKVARHGHHLTREYSVNPLGLLRVGEVMDTQVPTVPATTRVRDLAARIVAGDPQYTRQGLPIVDELGCLVGIITRDDVLRALNQDPDSERSVFEVATHDVVVTYPDALLQDAVAKMLRLKLERLLVVSPRDPRHLVGYLGRSEVLAAHMRQLDEEQLRERTWFRRTLPLRPQ
jgi:chloride channel protein, CIC family